MDESREELRRRLAHVEQAFIDERAERAQAQRRAVDLGSAVDTWRTRSEERTERIVKLEAERDELRTIAGWMRARVGARSRRREITVGAMPGKTSPREREKMRPSLPSVAVASNASESLGRIVAESRHFGLLDHSLDTADLVVVDPSLLTKQENECLSSWLSESVRCPIVVVDDGSDGWDSADLMLCGPLCGDGAQSCTAHLNLPDVIDIAVDTPHNRDAGRQSELIALVARESVLADSDGTPVGISSRLSTATPGAIASLAARGFAVAPSDGELRHEGAGVRARRWAWATRDPAKALEVLLAAANVPFRPIDRRIAGLLVTMRPENVRSAILLFSAQGYEPKELVVGCHGFDPSIVEMILAEECPELRAIVVGYSSDMSLGACLNDAASRTTAPLLAKIDDDDHYGPAYLEDGVQAIRYSGASVVGKFTHFTYLESSDTTVLRREGDEERFVDSMIPGPTLVFSRSAWMTVGFPDRPRKVDVFFVEGLRAAGFEIYSASRWDWTYYRGVAPHTWQVEDAVFGHGAREAWNGWHPERADL